MSIFLFLSIPLWFLFLNSFFKNEDVRKRDFFVPVGKGAILYVGALLLTWLFSRNLSLGEVTFFNLYFYNFLYYNGITIFIWLTLLVIVSSFKKRSGKEYRIREILLFLVPLFFGDSLYRIIIKESWYGIYELFYMPLGNMGMLLLFAVMIERMGKGSHVNKLLHLLFCYIIILIYNFIPTLISFNIILPSVIAGLILFGVSIMLFFRELNRNLYKLKNEIN